MFSLDSSESQDNLVLVDFTTADPDSSSVSENVMKTEEMIAPHDLQDTMKDVSFNSQSSDVSVEISEVEAGNNSSITLANDEIATMMVELNNSLEKELKDTKKAVKRLFKEIVAFKDAAKAVHAIWEPIYEFEQQESIRLEELHADIQDSIGTFPNETAESIEKK